MFSKTCTYALRAMIYIAGKSGEGTVVNIKEIAAQINSPELFIAKILQRLSRKGFLQSSKGRYGGFYISDREAGHSLADIVEAIDGDRVFRGCGLGLAFCSETNPCPIHHDFKKARDQLYQMYGRITLQQFRDGYADQELLLKRT
ncbi:RrF2 family transcriptional regulator [Chryseobacterium sp. MFBS3-17]|uniref:RrF2 family transcriptional regulator n=1 Tax=Chryseobacterium sp. MFBS3-17 TaxID=2886689 RepID=UPI001D0E9C8F|nr:Rrf2 family transcriptional regulator [Chryseobacterium sp. MFBS3-17]MCC2590022.1 Rrf2 family transcriptional regulator [Chryseobacterium sp. MFBS3-17]